MFKNRFFEILVAAALLAVLIVTVQEVTATKSVVSAINSAPDIHGANPELMIANRYTADSGVFSESNELTANPELSIVRRNSIPKSDVATSIWTNPEILLAHRYTAPSDGISKAAFLAANPELSVVRRYAVMEAGK